MKLFEGAIGWTTNKQNTLILIFIKVELFVII